MSIFPYKFRDLSNPDRGMVSATFLYKSVIRLYREGTIAVKSQVISLVLATFIGASAWAAQKPETDTTGSDRNKPAETKSPYTVGAINAGDYLLPYVESGAPVYGKSLEAKKIDRGIHAGRTVVVEGERESGKSASVSTWVRQQEMEGHKVNLLQLNYGAIVKGKHALEHANVLQSIADYISQLNHDNPSQTSVLYIKRLGDMGSEDARTLLEAVTRQGTPTIVESEHITIESVIKENTSLKSVLDTVVVTELASENLKSALRSYEIELKKQYIEKNNFDVQTADDFIDRIVKIVTDYMPNNQIKNGRELIYDVFYEYYTERFLNRGMLADLRDQLGRIQSQIAYSQSKTKDNPDALKKLEEQKQVIEQKIEDAKVAYIDLDHQLQKKQKQFEAAKGNLDNAMKLEQAAKPRFRFNFWARTDAPTEPSAASDITLKDLQDNVARLQTELNALIDKKAKTGTGEAAPRIVEDAIINMKASEKTGLPPEVFGQDMEALLAHIEDRIETFGQDDAKKAAASIMRNVFRGRTRSGISIIVAPGEPGTGKTSTGELLAKNARWAFMYNQMEHYSNETKANNVDGSGFGYKDSDRVDETLFGRMVKLPKFKIVMFDEWEKAFRELSKKFVGLWETGKLAWNGKEYSFRGTIFWITTNQGKDFFEKLENAALTLNYIQMEELEQKNGVSIEVPKELREKLKLNPAKENLDMLKSGLESMLRDLAMTVDELKDLVNAQGDLRTMKESNAFGKYLNSKDPDRWPTEILSRITVIPFRPHTPESIARTMEKFVRDFRKEMKEELKVEIYVDEAATDAIEKQFDRSTGARPLDINMRNFFTEVIYQMFPSIDATKQAIEITVEDGRFTGKVVDQTQTFNAIWGETGALQQLKGRMSEVELGNEQRKSEAGIITRAVREAIRTAK